MTGGKWRFLPLVIVLAAVLLLGCIAFLITRFTPISSFSARSQALSLDGETVDYIALKGVEGGWVTLRPGETSWDNGAAPQGYSMDFDRALTLLNSLHYVFWIPDIGSLAGISGWDHMVTVGLKDGSYYNLECGGNWISVNGFCLYGGGESLRQLFYL